MTNRNKNGKLIIKNLAGNKKKKKMKSGQCYENT